MDLASIAKSLKDHRQTWYFAVLHTGILVAFTVAVLVYNTEIGGFDRVAAMKVLTGQLPYFDFAVEYSPPITLVQCLPSLFTDTYAGYGWIFAAEMLVLDIIMLFVLARAARALGRTEFSVLALYTLAVIILGPIIVNRHDILPSVITMAAAALFIDRRTTLGWALLGLAAATKLYPAFIAPLFFIFQFTRRQDRALVKGLVAFAVVIIAVYLPVYLIDRESFSYIFTYHFQRGLHADSTGGGFLFLADVAGLTTVGAGLSYGSWNLIAPAAEKIAALSMYITVLLVLAVYLLYIIRTSRQQNTGQVDATAGSRQLMLFILVTLLAVIVTGKVFSPQYFVWLLPFVSLTLPDRKVPLVLFLAAALLTQINFPYMYIAFSQKDTAAVIVLVLRNCLLIAAAVVLAVQAARRKFTALSHRA